MAIPAMALLQQHDARWDMLIEPAVRRCAAIEARGHSELAAFGTGGCNPAVKPTGLFFQVNPHFDSVQFDALQLIQQFNVRPFLFAFITD